MKDQPARVLIIFTGGTFGMDIKPQLHISHLGPGLLKKSLFERAPELQSVAQCDIDILFNRDSAHMGPPEWIRLADRIRSKWSNYDGVVVLHGTDTLAYTASALSFLLNPCLKPIVITGAQKPLASLRNDARRNLVSAVEIAGNGPRELRNEVMVFFDDLLLKGNRVRKRSASEFSAFESPKALPLAIVGTSIRYQKFPKRLQTKKIPLKPIFSEKTAVMHITPGFPSRVVTDTLLSCLDGLVLVVFPSGTAPSHDPCFVRMLRAARKRKIPIVIVTESASDAPGDPTDSAATPAAYEAGKVLIDENCFWAGEMTTECAFVKASLLLGQGGGYSQFSRLWELEIAGEGSFLKG